LLEALGPQPTAIEVRFYLPEHRPDRLAALGEKYRSSHARLWDRDEAMMMRREALSTPGRRRRKASGAPLALGLLRELRQRLPLCVEVDGEPFRLLALEDGALVADLPALARTARGRRAGEWQAALSLARLSVRCPDRHERRRTRLSIGAGATGGGRSGNR
jgi:hypothetical protein